MHSTLPNQIGLDTGLITDTNAIANAFNNHFIAAGNLNEKTSTTNDGWKDTYEGIMHEYADGQGFSLSLFTEEKVIDALLAIDTKKATGADKLDPGLLARAAPRVSGALTHILNLTLTSEVTPKIWKTAYVLPLHRGGVTGDLDNYRPISKLSCIAKMLESLVNVQLRSFLSDCHALICFTCPCACLHPLQVSPIFPVIPCVFIPVFFVCFQFVLFVQAYQRFSCQLLSFPSLSFLVLRVLTFACPDPVTHPPDLAAWPWACRPVPLLHFWITERCLSLTLSPPAVLHLCPTLDLQPLPALTSHCLPLLLQ